MMPDVALLAQLEGLNPLNPTAPVSKSSGLVFKDMLLIVGACLVLAAILFACARVYVRNKQNRRHHEHHHHRDRKPAAARVEDNPGTESEGEDRGHHRRRRRRRRVRDHRPRNPTLAETGGLPPEKSPPPSPHAP